MLAWKSFWIDVCSLTLAACLALPPGEAAAGKGGPIEINQSRALRGNVTPGDLPGFPVQLTLPGSYILTSNLDLRGIPGAEDVVAILVSSDDVKLDLAGFGIRGPNTCSGNGVNLSCTFPERTGHGVQALALGRGVSVVNGFVRGMGGDGLHQVSHVREVTVSENAGDGIHDAFQVTECAAVQNRGDGISFFGAASLARDNSALSNKGDGIKFPTVALGNASSGNGGFALRSLVFGGYGNNSLIGGTNMAVIDGHEIGTNVCNGSTTCP